MLIHIARLLHKASVVAFCVDAEHPCRKPLAASVKRNRKMGAEIFQMNAVSENVHPVPSKFDDRHIVEGMVHIKSGK